MDKLPIALSEIRDNGKHILSRCHQLCSESTCKRKVECERAREDINALDTKCTAIENSSRKKEDEIKIAWENVNTIKRQLDDIQRTLQTDDVTNQLQESKQTMSVVDNSCKQITDQHRSDDETVRGIKANQTVGQMGTTSFNDTYMAKESDPNTNDSTSKTSTVATITCDDTQTETSTVQELVSQEQQRIIFGEHYWNDIAEVERIESAKLLHELNGFHTILCVDISESMLQKCGWEQASTFVKDYLNGLNEINTTDEYVGLVTFGHETAVKQRLSNNYTELLQVFNKLKLGGPSSLYGGLRMSIVSTKCSRYIARRLNNNIWIPNRIIIITDGRPTDVNVIAGPDTITSGEQMTKDLILKQLSLRRVMVHDIFFVPVGNADTRFIDTMVDVSGGMTMDYTHGKRLSRRCFLSKRADLLNRWIMHCQLSMREGTVTVEDQEDILSIEERSGRFSGIHETQNRVNEDCYHERIRSNLPTIGSRVRRGPEWIWNQEDSSGPGTIVGHAEKTNDVWIQWDKDGCINFYRYGDLGYDVLIVDEPRELQDSRQLAVGCNVKPGNGWNQSESKLTRGVVVKISSDKATVRWDNGDRGDFSIDLENDTLEYCSTLKRVETKTCDEAQTEAPIVKVDLVRQKKKRIIFGALYWKHNADDELKESEELFHDLEGYHTVLCVDISESMLENGGWDQASTFVNDYLNGLKETGTTDEYVALVTFGHETAVKQRLSNNYEELLRVFSDLQVGGPSSLYGGMLMSLASATCSRYFACPSNNDILVPRRVILVTDGRPTDVNIIAGPDRVTSCEELAKQLILQELSPRNVRLLDICFVPVGNADTKFVQAMIDVSGGLKMTYTHGRRLSRRSALSKHAGATNTSRLALYDHMSTRGQLTAEDQVDILSIEKRSDRFINIMSLLRRANKNCYHERIRSELPPIGSRVRRGPEWIWDQEDSSGPGTIIGHAEETEYVWTEWDTDSRRYFYRYGELGYDVLIVDEPRELKDERTFAVGCNVKPGKCRNHSESTHRRGVVVKVDSETATVRWDNARRGEFSVDREKGELEYCPTLKRQLEDNNDLSAPQTHQED